MIIKGKLVTLRPIRMSDARRFVKWLGDKRVNRFIATRNVSMKEELKWIRSLRQKKDNLHFAIDTKDGIHIGSLDFREIEKRNRHSFFGILIGDKRFWGKGYGTEAMQLLLDYGFKKLKLRRITLWVYAFNARAIALYKKLGFKKAGVLKKRTFLNGKWYDDILMSVTKEEFKG